MSPAAETAVLVLRSFVGPLSGLIRFAMLVAPPLRDFGAMIGEHHPADVDVWPVAERYLGHSSGAWLQSIGEQSRSWVNNYDGATSCAWSTQAGSVLIIIAQDICYDVSPGHEVCAEHLSIVGYSRFANLAVAEISYFLRDALPV